MNRDFMGIVLEVGQESQDEAVRRLYEDVRDGRFVDMSVYGVSEKLDESTEEPLGYQGLKVVKEKYGAGVSLMEGTVERRYVSDKFTSEQLEHKLAFLLEHQEPTAVRTWLGNNTFCYLTQETEEINEGAVKELIMVEEGDFVEFEGSTWVVGELLERGQVGLVAPNKKIVRVSQSKIKLADIKKITAKEKSLAVRLEKYSGRLDDFFKHKPLDEATQAADAATKTDQDSLSSKNPVEGKAYEFEDGVFVVDSIIDGVVYLIGSDDEYYSMKIEDFQNEVVTIIDEAELEDEPKYQAMVKKAFPGWVFVKSDEDMDKTGIVMYAMVKGDNDVEVFLHLGEESYTIYSDGDDKAPELEGKLSGLQSGLNKMAKYFGADEEVDEATINEEFPGKDLRWEDYEVQGNKIILTVSGRDRVFVNKDKTVKPNEIKKQLKEFFEDDDIEAAFYYVGSLAKTLNESEEELNEGVEVDVSKWSFASGKSRPSGRGVWFFKIGKEEKEFSGLYAEAKKQAIKLAKTNGVTSIELMS